MCITTLPIIHRILIDPIKPLIGYWNYSDTIPFLPSDSVFEAGKLSPDVKESGHVRVDGQDQNLWIQMYQHLGCKMIRKTHCGTIVPGQLKCWQIQMKKYQSQRSELHKSFRIFKQWVFQSILTGTKTSRPSKKRKQFQHPITKCRIKFIWNMFLWLTGVKENVWWVWL